MNREVVKENEKDPTWNCLVGTRDDIPCPVCGSHAWKRYGYHQNVACRKCGKQIQTFEQKITEIFIVVCSLAAAIFFTYTEGSLNKILSAITGIFTGK